WQTASGNNSFVRGNFQALFHDPQLIKQTREALFFPALVEGAQSIVSLAFAAFGVRKLVGGKTLVVRGMVRKTRRFFEILRCPDVIVKLVAIQPCQRFVELRFLRIVGNPTNEKILAQLEIIVLQPATRSRWFGIVFHRRCARIPSHMPSCYLPEKNGTRLQFGGLPQTQKKIGPIGPFPGGVGIDEKEIGHDGTKSTEHGDEGGLTD